MLDRILSTLGKVPGALMILPLFLGAFVNTFIPEVLDIGSFTTALFRDGTAVLIGLFFFSVGSQISFKTAVPSLEKGAVILVAKFGIAVVIGLAVAFLTPNGSLWGLLPLAIIAAMSNSNGSLFVALTQQFGSRSDRGSIAVLSINDGPFLTMVALGAAGLAQFPIWALVAAILPMIFGFVFGNLSDKAREFLAPGERLIIPFVAFSIGAGIDFRVLLSSGAVGIFLGLVSVAMSAIACIGGVYLWHKIRRTPKGARNLVSGAAESAVAGNAIATPAALAAIDPSLEAIQAAATAQIAAAVVVTAFISPFLTAYIHKRQLAKGISPANEDAYFEGTPVDEISAKPEQESTNASDSEPRSSQELYAADATPVPNLSSGHH